MAQRGRGNMTKRKKECYRGALLVGDWLTVSQYAAREGISRQQAYNRIKSGTVVALKVGVMMVRA